jgi:molybdopterin-guanine dinucleotide biosynthesis protein A
VLAGGRSVRFGADKLAADLGGIPLLQHAVRRVAEVCGDVVVVVAHDAAAPSPPPGIHVRVARDAEEGKGPLAGLVAALAEVGSDLALVGAGDMPTMAPAVLREMLRVAGAVPVDAVALQDGEHVRPLPCVVSVDRARTDAHALLDMGVGSLRAMLDSLGVMAIDETTWRRLDPTGATLRDVDTPGDLPRR